MISAKFRRVLSFKFETWKPNLSIACYVFEKKNKKKLTFTYQYIYVFIYY